MPLIPTHATSEARGPSDWLWEMRPQANPPKGNTEATASRSVHAPPTRAGTMPSRPATVFHCREP